MRISVIGGGTPGNAGEELAAEVGERLARRGHTLICGGRGGVMAAACRGAREAGGETVGILPGTDPADANPAVTLPIVTGLGDARNVLVATNGDGVIAIGGRYGTLSEIAFALNADRPVAGLRTHDVAGVEPVATPAEAVAYVERAATPVFD